ncbi:MAG: carbamoyltransferase HypF [Thiomicrorhabdus sp.]|nr:carbamoyltransferase HypF [Thiomicrorhabdus sp.]
MFAKIQVTGVVQGVGFRPFIWNLAHALGLLGWVCNDASGVSIFVNIADTPSDEMAQQKLEHFLQAIVKKAPPLAQVDAVVQQTLMPNEILRLQEADAFLIVQTQSTGMQTSILADSATCQACLNELQNPQNRRYGYAFINCTHCGPRYSIIRAMPYDRDATSMAGFKMCPRCLEEYQNPADRRFHAQPNACADCGPLLQLFYNENQTWQARSLTQSQMIDEAVQLLQQGGILAVKGIGGIHLVCDATHTEACETLRLRKNRPEKPFALMGQNIKAIQPYVQVSQVAKKWLQSPQAPIVLMPKQPQVVGKHALSDAVAPKQSRLGFMLPSNPIHHLLLAKWQTLSEQGVLVFTSANLSGEPQLYQDLVAEVELGTLADAYLSHNREIVRRLEDSVVAILPNQQQHLVIRQARGFSPYRISLPEGFESNRVVATGADLKSSVAVRNHQEIVLSHYLGNLSSFSVQEAYRQTWQDFLRLYQIPLNHVVHDQHPSYYSTQFLEEISPPPLMTAVQHHHAHFNACLLENGVPKEADNSLGIILDGLGYGEDGSLWGGEFLYGHYQSVERVAHLNARPLLGGDKANLEPWRNLMAQLYALEDWPNLRERYAHLSAIQRLNQKPLALLEQALHSGIQCPLSSSAGRLFDAVSALCGLCFERQSYEGQAAMALEALLSEQLINKNKTQGYFMGVDTSSDRWQLQSGALFQSILDDLAQGVAIADIAARFHIGFAHALVKMALRLQTRYPFKRVVLSGGVCQNGWLMQLVREAFPKEMELCFHQNTPANDQSIAMGQLCLV